jgi:hypothetical protein
MLLTYFEAVLSALMELAESVVWELAESLLHQGVLLLVGLVLVLIGSAAAAAARCFRSRKPSSAPDPSQRASAPD